MSPGASIIPRPSTCSCRAEPDVAAQPQVASFPRRSGALGADHGRGRAAALEVARTGRIGSAAPGTAAGRAASAPATRGRVPATAAAAPPSSRRPRRAGASAPVERAKRPRRSDRPPRPSPATGVRDADRFPPASSGARRPAGPCHHRARGRGRDRQWSRRPSRERSPLARAARVPRPRARRRAGGAAARGRRRALCARPEATRRLKDRGKLRGGHSRPGIR